MLKKFFRVAFILLPELLVTQPKSLGTVRGVVYDSIARAPVAKAAVWVSGSSRSTVADNNGRFELSEVPVGTRFISFSSPTLDSLGLGTLGTNVAVNADGAHQVRLTVPSFRSMWHALCSDGTSAVKDSGIVWGTIRDAATDTRLSGARASFSWNDLRVGADSKTIETVVASRSVKSDSTGTYYICGVPDGTVIHAIAEGAGSSSGVVSYSIGSHRLVRVDLLVSTDMITKSKSASGISDSMSVVKLRGTSRLTGVVTDASSHLQLNATIIVSATDTTVQTRDDGTFSFDKLPAGTQLVEVRKVGYAPKQVLVDLRPAANVDIGVVLSKVNQLETVHVKDKNMGRDRADFESRRRAGFGVFFDEKDFKNKIDLPGTLQGRVPGADIRRGIPSTSISIQMNQQSFTKTFHCDPTLWLDGIKVPIEEINDVPFENFRAIEVYPHVGSAPPGYIGFNACGVVLFWTKFARWR